MQFARGPLPVLGYCMGGLLALGLAMRLGQRLSGGVAGPLEISSLSIDDTTLTLSLPDGKAVLYGEAVERRHKQLASVLGRVAKLA